MFDRIISDPALLEANPRSEGSAIILIAGGRMAQILVRDLSPDMVKRLKNRAERNGRSLQGEAKFVLESAAKLSMSEAQDVARKIRQSLEGKMTSDSADLIREDRER